MLYAGRAGAESRTKTGPRGARHPLYPRVSGGLFTSGCVKASASALYYVAAFT